MELPKWSRHFDVLAHVLNRASTDPTTPNIIEEFYDMIPSARTPLGASNSLFLEPKGVRAEGISRNSPTYFTPTGDNPYARHPIQNGVKSLNLYGVCLPWALLYIHRTIDFSKTRGLISSI
jgi:hypothetical protein